jgi:hypothetical protein
MKQRCIKHKNALHNISIKTNFKTNIQASGFAPDLRESNKKKLHCIRHTILMYNFYKIIFWHCGFESS